MIEPGIVMEALTKDYDAMCPSTVADSPAVEGLTVAIPVGECFGLFGVNGAGKTTTCEMLAGNLLLTSGMAHVDGFDVTTNAREVCISISPYHHLPQPFHHSTRKIGKDGDKIREDFQLSRVVLSLSVRSPNGDKSYIPVVFFEC